MSTKKLPISYAYRPVVVVDANGKKKVMYEKFHPITTGNAVVIDGKTLKNKLKEYYDKGEVDALLKTLGDERPEVTDANYYEMIDVNDNLVKVSKTSAAAMVADVIKSMPDLQAKVTFGAVDSAGLASVVAGNLYLKVFVQDIAEGNYHYKRQAKFSFTPGCTCDIIVELRTKLNKIYTFYSGLDVNDAKIMRNTPDTGDAWDNILYYRVSGNTLYLVTRYGGDVFMYLRPLTMRGITFDGVSHEDFSESDFIYAG